ncbi:MAG: peptidylprolyl isomerase [Actinomycetales bacterium]|nr:peptidylprolyl isomerase [Actinomycetales bacterium]
MSSNRRQRELARAKYERQQARRSRAAQRRRIQQRIVAAAVVVVLLGAGATWFVLGRSTATPADPAQAQAAASALASAIGASPAAPAAPTPSATASTGALDCAPPMATRADNLNWPSAPPVDPAQPGAGTITLATNCGAIVIETLPELAPATVASEVFLTENGFYNATSCHRLTTEGIFVLQCGDPTGTGSGGPGYTVPDENLPAADGVNYPAGTVAMANAGPNTSGSQFFIVYADTTLPPGYSIWGRVISGLDVVSSVAGAGVTGGGSDGAPAQPITIETATFTKG